MDHFPQSLGGAFDLFTEWIQRELDLRAVILDCTEPYRRPCARHDNPDDRLLPAHACQASFPVERLNTTFHRAVPYGISCLCQKGLLDDPRDDVPPISTVRHRGDSKKPVYFTAQNTDSPPRLCAQHRRHPQPRPALFRERLVRLHLPASANGPVVEWDTLQAPNAAVFVAIVPTDTTVIYPCATAKRIL